MLSRGFLLGHAGRLPRSSFIFGLIETAQKSRVQPNRSRKGIANYQISQNLVRCVLCALAVVAIRKLTAVVAWEVTRNHHCYVDQ